MGLDMYMFATTKENVSEFDENTPSITTKDTNLVKEFDYWRKFNAFHGWVENYYNKLGGEEEFNCVKVPVTERFLKELEEVVKERELEPTSGFFFGSQEELEDEDYELLEELITKCRSFLAESSENVLYYDSWW
jgi:hypothetical protein